MKKSHLTIDQRYKIQHQREAGKSQTAIALFIRKHKSVVSRELKRNKNDMGRYKARHGCDVTEIRKERLKHQRKLTAEMEKQIVQSLSDTQWSPGQIKGRSQKEGKPMVSHERIYLLIRKDKQKAAAYKSSCFTMKHID